MTEKVSRSVSLEKEEEEEDYDKCVECGSYDFFYDSCTWESTCRGCGLVGSYEIGYQEDYTRPKTYFKHNYFTNTILMNAMNKGFKITRFEMVEMERRYKLCVKRFYETQEVHKRKYMINASFVLSKIGESMDKKNIVDFIKLPKKCTLKRLEKDWILINPFVVA